ncbi:MAG TPA: response regulator [Candidatus Thermoplasmatota archaeon]|nr:response regulator [Candidatus Thermoplasmatota archaeon]
MERPRLLLVDDEPDILRSLELLLLRSRPRLEVLTAANGAEALLRLESTPVDLVVTDYRMPKLDGLRLVRTVRERWPDRPSLLLTAYPDLDLAIEALNAGHVRRFFVKPVEPVKLLATIDELVAKAYAARQRLVAFARAGWAERKAAASQA